MIHFFSGRRMEAAAAVCALLLHGCVAGPNFRKPDAPAVSSYTGGPRPGETVGASTAGGAVQKFVPGGELPYRWWELFGSANLDRWIREAFANNLTLTAAEATLRRAQEMRRIRYADLLPSVDASLGASRQKISGSSFGQGNAHINPFTLFNASVDVAYTLDLAGRTRRELEALQAQVDYSRFQLEGAHITLASNIVTAVIQEASLRAQLAATREIVAAQEESLRMIERKFELGGIARAEVLAQRTLLAQSRATLPPLEKQLSQTRHLLAVLGGRFPGDAEDLPEFSLEEMRLPEELPVSLPSALVRQRPDIRSAEELLHAASAQIGVATAELYPQVTLSAQLGTSALRAGDLFSSGSAVWGVGAGLLQPVFHGGALRANQRAAVAGFDESAALYRETVLRAFRDVADVLRALEFDAEALKAQSAAEAAAQDSLDIARRQFHLGATSYLSLLDAQRQYHQTRILRVQAQAARYADTAGLFQALGGGWWNREGRTVRQ
ncbi:MAG: efflux transporter outer membrane subunit [Deltaproteobacteria bacterium]|nr:efflux transporter outer membrane subunit [Deltaproteobacteria bacterium]